MVKLQSLKQKKKRGRMAVLLLLPLATDKGRYQTYSWGAPPFPQKTPNNTF